MSRPAGTATPYIIEQVRALTLVPRWELRARVSAALALHVPYEYGILRIRTACELDGERWPCRTAVALAGVDR